MHNSLNLNELRLREGRALVTHWYSVSYVQLGEVFYYYIAKMSDDPVIHAIKEGYYIFL